MGCTLLEGLATVFDRSPLHFFYCSWLQLLSIRTGHILQAGVLSAAAWWMLKRPMAGRSGLERGRETTLSGRVFVISTVADSCPTDEMT